MLEGDVNLSKTERLQAVCSEKDWASCKALPKLAMVHSDRQSSSTAKLRPQAPNYARAGSIDFQDIHTDVVNSATRLPDLTAAPASLGT